MVPTSQSGISLCRSPVRLRWPLCTLPRAHLYRLPFTSQTKTQGLEVSNRNKMVHFQIEKHSPYLGVEYDMHVQKIVSCKTFIRPLVLAEVCILLVIPIFLGIHFNLCYFPLEQGNELIQTCKWLTCTVWIMD